MTDDNAAPLTRPSIPELLVPRGARIHVAVLLFALVVVSALNYRLAADVRLDKAQLSSWQQVSMGNELIVRAMVEPTTEAGLNLFVKRRFGERTMCTWSSQFVYCGYGNTTVIYDTDLTDEYGGRLLFSPPYNG